MNKFSTFEAKTKLSELIKRAVDGEPQIITNNGVERAVVISYQEYLTLKARKQPLGDFFRDSPLRGSDIDLERSKDTGRAPIEFDQ